MGECTYVNRLPGERAKRIRSERAKGPTSIHCQRKDNHCPFEQKIHSGGSQRHGRKLSVAIQEQKKIFGVRQRGAATNLPPPHARTWTS